VIPVTKTYLPPMEEYTEILKRVWDTSWITNRGAIALELESKLKSRLGVEHLLLMTNGTLPIQIALKQIAKGKEVITTPFSYVATTSSIVWEGYEPVFVDIERDHWTIDPTKIEAAITEDTGAILATHVFGNPCDVEAMEILSEQYDIPVIYDAAHAYGVNYKGKSVFAYGDASTCSFHATKLFHTGEGGAIVTKDQTLFDSVYYSHNFGHDGYENYHGVGINAKISELQAAMGLAMLSYMDDVVLGRKRVVDLYNSLLPESLPRLSLRAGTEWNYCYYPILMLDDGVVRQVESALMEVGVKPRRYFYPSLNTLDYVNRVSMPVSENIASRVLCLPLYFGLEEDSITEIANIVNQHV